MIKIRSLKFGYRRNRPLFQNLDLTIHGGHIYGLLGKNGSGKSTLLKSIAGLVFPDSGACSVMGFNAAKRQPAFLQQLFFISEDIFLPAVTAVQLMNSTCRFYPAFDMQQFFALLKEFGVPKDQLLTRMSLGQQKKALISFGLAANTPLLIMDEPTNGLDIPSKAQFRKLIAAALNDERCILISTHQIRDLDSMIDAVIVIDDGKIVVDASLERIADRFRFSNHTRAGQTRIIYSEPDAFGTNTMSISNGEEEGRVDLELFFNAVTSKAKTIADILNG